MTCSLYVLDTVSPHGGHSKADVECDSAVVFESRLSLRLFGEFWSSGVCVTSYQPPLQETDFPMRTFLVSYDLAAPASNRHAMTTAIMMLGSTWARPLDQTWYIKTDLEEDDINSVLTRLLDDDDGLIVQCVRDDAHLANTSLRWFKQRPLPRDAVDTNVVAFPVVPELPSHAEELPLAEAS